MITEKKDIEETLKQMAQKLLSMNDDQLVLLREKYLRIVDNFEPTERWEEAVLILAFIQGKMMKEQLKRYHWAVRTKLNGRQGTPPEVFTLNLNPTEKAKKTAKIIEFNPQK